MQCYSCRRKAEARSGAVLLFSLVCLLALSGIVILSVGKASREAVEARRLAAEYQADLLAESVLSLAREIIRRDKDSVADTPDDPWVEPVEGEDFELLIEPCNARLNLNDAVEHERTGETIITMMEEAELEPDNIDYLLDWLDKDLDEERITGSESRSYFKVWPRYRPRNGAMPVPEEILLVRGFEDVDREWLEKFFTVWGKKNININFVSRELFEAYLPEIASDWPQVENWRESQGFRSKDDLMEALPALEADAELWKTVSDAVSINSIFFRVTIEIRLPFVYERRRYIVERNPILVDKLPAVLRGDVLEVIPAE
jgi:general secretion pathway protein K